MANALIAGQDMQSIAVLEAELRGLGHTVTVVSTGLEAYDQALAHCPDIVFLEADLPVFGGYAVCEMLRNDPGIPPDLPVVFLSTSDTQPRTLERVGATGTLPKQHEASQLQEMLAAYQVV